MKAEEFDSIRRLEDTHWWYVGRKRLLRHLIDRLHLHDALILDAGCGTGFAGKQLAKCGTIISLDSSLDAFGDATDIPNRCLANMDKAPFPDDTFDLVVAMDLLEHIDDDMTAIGEMYRICKKGGYAFITVPAYRWMWSAHDEALDHKRRYSLSEIVGKLRMSGFIIEKASYFVCAAFPVGLIHRMLSRNSPPSSDLTPVPAIPNAVLKSIMRGEAWLAWHLRLPFGMTAVVLARKDAQSDRNR